MKIPAYIINRNLLSTLKDTVEFLKKDDRVNVWILDQNSTYKPLLDYYKTNPCNVHYCRHNIGAYAYWNTRSTFFSDRGHYIVTDSDCNYEGVPSDWLDRMLEVLEKTDMNKVGFSLSLKDLPNNDMSRLVRDYENKCWVNETEYGYKGEIDTTFALYRPNSDFKYEALRLKSPYTIKHTPWYLDKSNLNEEWRYYLENINIQSFWGQQIKKAL